VTNRRSLWKVTWDPQEDRGNRSSLLVTAQQAERREAELESLPFRRVLKTCWKCHFAKPQRMSENRRQTGKRTQAGKIQKNKNKKKASKTKE
jgi:hypothetical protein